ncbi:MAG TPA: hypothetical protein ENI23_10605 [bacterium]|nr:hypothetical protein [bacterium]
MKKIVEWYSVVRLLGTKIELHYYCNSILKHYFGIDINNRLYYEFSPEPFSRRRILMDFTTLRLVQTEEL